MNTTISTEQMRTHATNVERGITPATIGSPPDLIWTQPTDILAVESGLAPKADLQICQALS